jgi:hypothetical protein
VALVVRQLFVDDPVGFVGNGSLVNMGCQRFSRWIVSCALLGLAVVAVPNRTSAQEIDFSRIGAFESMGSGTVRTGSPPKTLFDDDEQHAIFLTIWNSDTDAKVYWRALDSDQEQTSVIHGTGVRAFQTNGEFKIQALGEGDHEVKYDYVLLHLRKKS